MRNYIIYIFTILLPVLVIGQTPTENYVKTTTYQTATQDGSVPSDQRIEQIGYFDGLGRGKQTIVVGAAGRQQIINLLDWEVDWHPGNGSTSLFNQLGKTSENLRLYGEDPFGDHSLLWQCGGDPEEDEDGGWNTDYFSIDNSKGYRYSTWVKRTHSQDGTTYHGTHNVDNLDGSTNGNAYFWLGDLPELETWYLLVGVVHPHTYSGVDTGRSGVYDLEGNKVLDGTEFKWRANETTTRFRNYFYNAIDTGTRQYFYAPLLEELGDDQQPIAQLIEEAKPRDIVTHMEYDQFGRQTKQYLPYANGISQNGAIQPNPLAELSIFYNTEKYEHTTNPYSETRFEASPLSRPLEQGAPGASWAVDQANDTDHTIKFGYHTNAAEEVKRFDVAFENGDTQQPKLMFIGHYTAGQLYKSITKDENWQPNQTQPKNHTTEEFKDKQNRVVLKRTYNNGLSHDTQYVYDDFGNLSYVIPPLASDEIIISQEILEGLCYQYRYDYRNRLIEKKIPGKGWEYIVYDKLDRPVLTQDTNLQADGIWLFTKYDAFGRVVITGAYKNPGADRKAMQNVVNYQFGLQSGSYYEKRVENPVPVNTINGAVKLFYSYTTFPTNAWDIHTINYYDDYEWDVPTRIIPRSTAIGVTSGVSVSLAGITNDVTGWNSGFNTKETIIADGYMEFSPTTIGLQAMIGVSGVTSNENFHYNTIDHAIQLHVTNKYAVYEEGVWEFTSQDTYQIGDVFRVEREGSQINYLKNGVVFYSSQTPSTGTLIGDSAMHDIGAGVDDVSIVNSAMGQQYTENTKGLATGGKIRVLGTNQWITSAAYYDEKARPIASFNENPYLETTDAVFSVLDFTGLVVASRMVHNKNEATIITEDTFTYDHMNRLLTQKQRINGQTEELIVSNHYDELGQLEKKQVGNTAQAPLQNVDYTYNIRGWLKGINDVENIDNDLFTFKLNYDTTAIGGSQALYNGNISETIWRTASIDPTNGSSNLKRGYTYGYDALNRITFADTYSGENFSQYQSRGIHEVNYDKNGNLLRLHRKGVDPIFGSTNYYFDKLEYSYDGNQLVTVTDHSNNTEGFKDGNSVGEDYVYDVNGNMTIDRNKGITEIQYNHLNLPTKVTIANATDSGTIAYVYDATGTKLRKQVIDEETVTATDYAGGYIYSITVLEGTQLQFFPQPEGYVEPNGAGDFTYVYQYKDHLGNNRLNYADDNNDGIINTTTEIREENNYYPFGLQHKGYNQTITGRKHNYGFGGKEEQNELGLEWIDITARNYDPAIGRWMNLDPLAEEMKRHSPYNYAFDNPISFIDPDGMKPFWINNGDGTYTAEAGDSASTLATDAGITFDKAKEIMANTPNESSSLGTMGTYIDTEDGVEKSAVDEGDVVTVPEQVTKLEDNSVELNTLIEKEVTQSQGEINIREDKKDSVQKIVTKAHQTVETLNAQNNIDKFFYEKESIGIKAANALRMSRIEGDSTRGVKVIKKLNGEIDSITKSIKMIKAAKPINNKKM